MQPVINFFRRFKFRDAYIFAVILILTAFAIASAWPGNPDRYLPSFIPWPSAAAFQLVIGNATSFVLAWTSPAASSITLTSPEKRRRYGGENRSNQFLDPRGRCAGEILSLNPR